MKTIKLFDGITVTTINGSTFYPDMDALNAIKIPTHIKPDIVRELAINCKLDLTKAYGEMVILTLVVHKD